MLNPQMLAEAKDIIFNKSNLPESVKEPVHIAIKNIMALENTYNDFLSREIAGEGTRGNILFDLVTVHGGDSQTLIDWFMSYETADSASPAWGS